MKPRHNLSFAEERELGQEIETHLRTRTRELMAKYNVSRTVISRITRECKMLFRESEKRIRQSKQQPYCESVHRQE